MICAHCHHKIPDLAENHSVFLEGVPDVATVCHACYLDNTIPMVEARWCERCEVAMPEDNVFYVSDGVTDDAPYYDVPLCQDCYDIIMREYGVDENDVDDYPEEQAGPSGAETPPDKDFQMDA